MTSHATAYTRYAVYWAPEDTDPLAAFGAAWLGHDPRLDVEAAPPRLRLGLPGDVADEITREPRRYGLHATLKAPFHLKAGTPVEDLVAGIAALAGATPAFSTPALRLTDLSGFLALCPSGPSPKLDALAERCVVDLDAFRAPLDAGGIARRKPVFLSPVQREMLKTWGYPHVLSQFRFHITLTKRLSETERTRVAPLLEIATAPLRANPFAVGSIALFGDPGDGLPFRLVQRFPLASA